MSLSSKTIFEHLKAAAQLTGKEALLEYITSREALLGSPKLNILVVGTPGTGRFSLLNAILDEGELLPASPLPRLPASIFLSYGETTNLELCTKNGLKRNVSQPQLRSTLYNTGPDKGDYTAIEIKVQNDILKNSDFRIETISPAHSAESWKAILATIDYTILILKAPALLSEQEKLFIRNVLNVDFGLQRVAIIINQVDLVEEDELVSLGELVRTFLGPFESQPIIIEFSANLVNKSLKREEIPSPESGYENFFTFLKEDLLQKEIVIRTATIQQTIENCLNELENEVLHQQVLLGTSTQTLQKYLFEFEENKRWLQKRISYNSRQAETFIILLKEELLRDMDRFGQSIREQLPAELGPLHDIVAIKRYLPGYLETLWKEFFALQQFELAKRLNEEVARIEENVITDLEKLLSAPGNDFPEGLVDSFGPQPDHLRSFILPGRNNSPFAAVSTRLQLGGLLGLITFFPAMGLASIVVGQVIRLAASRNIEAADKQVVNSAAEKAIKDSVVTLNKEIEIYFARFNVEMQEAIRTLYEREVERIKSELEESLSDQEKAQSKKVELELLSKETIPLLRLISKNIKG